VYESSNASYAEYFRNKRRDESVLLMAGHVNEFPHLTAINTYRNNLLRLALARVFARTRVGKIKLLTPE
jgi:hypothetical protein